MYQYFISMILCNLVYLRLCMCTIAINVFRVNIEMSCKSICWLQQAHFFPKIAIPTSIIEQDPFNPCVISNISTHIMFRDKNQHLFPPEPNTHQKQSLLKIPAPQSSSTLTTKALADLKGCCSFYNKISRSSISLFINTMSILKLD